MPIYKTTAPKKDGKIQYRVMVSKIGVTGQRRQISRRIYGLAEAKALETELERQLNEMTLPARMTIRQLFDDYMTAKKAEVRRSTYEKSKSTLEHYVISSELVGARLDKLSVPLLQQWKNRIAEQPTKIVTKNNAIKELNAMLNYAEKMEYIPRNPLKLVGRFKDANFTPEQEKIHYYTAEEFKRFIALARDDRKTLTDYGCYVFFNIAFYTGMRKGEIYALRWTDIYDNIIHIRRSLNQKMKTPDGEYVEGPPKNKSSVRDLQMPCALVSVLDEYRDILTQKYEYSASMRVCGGYTPVSDTSVENYNTKYAELAGLPHIRIHDYRHTHATFLINKGVPIQIVSRRLGHADVKMTWNTYYHFYPQAEDQVLDVLDDL